MHGVIQLLGNAGVYNVINSLLNGFSPNKENRELGSIFQFHIAERNGRPTMWSSGTRHKYTCIHVHTIYTDLYTFVHAMCPKVHDNATGHTLQSYSYSCMLMSNLAMCVFVCKEPANHDGEIFSLQAHILVYTTEHA